jgi:hypothetical protein
MSALTLRLAFPGASTVGVRDNREGFTSLCCTTFSKVRKQLLQERLNLQKLLSLPNVLRMDITIAHCVLTRLVDGANANQSMKSLNDVAVYRTERQAHDTSIFGDVDAALSLEKASHPT